MGIFEPYRALGYITDNIPFAVQRRGLETFITVSVGKAFQIFNCAKLSLVFVSPQLKKRIRALACWRDYTYAASEKSIFIFRRAQQVAQWSAHQSKIMHLLVLGDHIISVDADGWIFVWEVKSVGKEAIPSRKILVEEPVSPTCLMHPDTYLNKIIVGTEEGSLYLWNISTGKLLYKFKGWASPVRCCVASPALDVVGIGCADGKIYIHNLRFDETVITFSHTTRGAVTGLSFRTDGQPILAAGGSSGVISIWNLEKQKLQGVIKDAHESAICALHFLPNEPVLLSAAADNSLKMWIFDSNDGEARLLRFRSGHSAPPTFMRYYGSGRHILSAGQDRAFRMFSTIQDQQSRELSQGHTARRAKKLKLKEEELKLPPVVCLDAAEIRERDWCNVVTCHVDDTVAYTWRLQNFVIGEQILKPTGGDCGAVKACALSPCGNFALIGTEAGHVERFNIQSGISRQIYCDASLTDFKAHEGAIAGLACDGTNTLVISGSYDSHVKVWNFKGGQEKSRWSVGSPIVKLSFHQGSGLLATVSDDLVLRVYDVIAAKLVRVFEGHNDRVTDLCFSQDGKWILSSAMDGTIRIWGVVSAKQLDAMHVIDPVTSLSLSPNMDMLATTHIGHNGIYLWANRLMYTGMITYESIASGEKVVEVSLPTMSSANDLTENDKCIKEPIVQEMQHNGGLLLGEGAFITSPQIMPELVTLSLLPKAQWRSLVNLDTIKIRNKPVEPPKKPEKAPFFLPSLSSLSGDLTFVKSSSMEDAEGLDSKEGKKGQVSLKNSEKIWDSDFVKLLHTCSEAKDFGHLLLFLKSLSPSEIDLEFQVLRVVDDLDVLDKSRGKQLQVIGLVLDFLIEAVNSSRDFEFIQALTRLFLKVHGETILEQPFLQEKAKVLLDLMSASWERLDHMFQNVRCTLSFLSNALY